MYLDDQIYKKGQTDDKVKSPKHFVLTSLLNEFSAKQLGICLVFKTIVGNLSGFSWEFVRSQLGICLVLVGNMSEKISVIN